MQTDAPKARAKTPTVPLEITAHLADGRINSADGVMMLDSILYHAWFQRYAPHVLEGMGSTTFNGHIGLPLRHLPGNRWAASKGIYEEIGQTVEHVNKRPDFFEAEKLDRLDMRKGLISSSVGEYRAYRMPGVIRTVKSNCVTFWAMGHADKVQSLLDGIVGVGKKTAIGWGWVDAWTVRECKEDYSLWHPQHGLMRPVEVDSDEARALHLEESEYPVMQYGIRPPYWKAKNMRLCYAPIA